MGSDLACGGDWCPSGRTGAEGEDGPISTARAMLAWAASDAARSAFSRSFASEACSASAFSFTAATLLCAVPSQQGGESESWSKQQAAGRRQQVHIPSSRQAPPQAASRNQQATRSNHQANTKLSTTHQAVSRRTCSFSSCFRSSRSLFLASLTPSVCRSASAASLTASAATTRNLSNNPSAQSGGNCRTAHPAEDHPPPIQRPPAHANQTKPSHLWPPYQYV